MTLEFYLLGFQCNKDCRLAKSGGRVASSAAKTYCSAEQLISWKNCLLCVYHPILLRAIVDFVVLWKNRRSFLFLVDAEVVEKKTQNTKGSSVATKMASQETSEKTMKKAQFVQVYEEILKLIQDGGLSRAVRLLDSASVEREGL
ncbi:hypothetical protein CHS0354_016330 [Potamilus streckersoni]|uniref:Uncharacterized protein n=1 Tax=Potamilus streckersoni TaxID=2493646 RepID=A0AAE0S715_9BIVA|nr:hypothetical protein CHS0354_016330 [Potamilus streckersoni]